MDAVGPSVSLPVLSPPLKAQQLVQVTQQICGISTPLGDGGGSSTSAVTPAPQPSVLGSNSNYILWGGPKTGGGFIALQGVVVTVEITEDLVGSPPFAFQLNGYSPSGDKIDFWQQYGLSMAPGSNQLNSYAENWPPTGANLFNIEPSGFVSLPNQTTIPKGFKMVIELTYSGSNISGSVCNVYDGSGTLLGTQTITIIGQPLAAGGTATAADLAPLVAMQMDVVGWASFASTVFSSGAGTITYKAKTLMTATGSVPSDAEGFPTGETGSSVYGELPSGSSLTFVQTFKVTADKAILVTPRSKRGRVSRKLTST